MPVTSYTEGDLFVVRTFKRHVNNIDRVWANNYEFRAKIAGDETVLAILLQRVREFEQLMSLSVVQFVRVTCSTWEADSVPYDPANFISIPMSFLGEAEGGESDPLPLNQCLDVNRIPASGRFGHLFYRGILTEGMVSSPAGQAVLSSPGGIVGLVGGALDDSSFGSYLDGDDTNLELVMVNSNATQIRRVVGFIPQKVSTVPMNHTWFNRTSP